MALTHMNIRLTSQTEMRKKNEAQYNTGRHVKEIVSYCLCLSLSGLAQGPIWPACAKLMSSVCPSNKKASVLGIIFCAIFITINVT